MEMAETMEIEEMGVLDIFLQWLIYDPLSSKNMQNSQGISRNNTVKVFFSTFSEV